MTFDEIMANLTSMERTVIEDEIDRQRDEAFDNGYSSGLDTGYESAAVDYY